MEIDPKMVGEFEIILVQNDQIDLLANLVSLKDGRCIVYGRVVLENEKKLLFSNDGEPKGVRRSEFVATCQAIAASCGAELLRRKFPQPASPGVGTNDSSVPFHVLN